MLNQNRLIETFIDLVKIDSPSGEEKNIAKFLNKRLSDIGAKTAYDSYGNLIARIEGTGRPLMLNAHMDTVEPGRNIHPIVEGNIIKTDGKTVLGGDPKAGLSAIVEAVASVLEEKRSHVPLELVFTREEETGLFGAVNLDYKKVTAKQGITFDGEYGIENIDLSAPGYNRVDATIAGRGAHAGAEPEKGISAIRVASEIIAKLPLGRIDPETTTNIGLIEGGSARNAVPETVVVKGEIRSRNIAKLENVTREFKEIFSEVLNSYPKANMNLDIVREFDPYIINKNSRMIKRIVHIFQAMNITPLFHDSGGGTDNNIFQTHGIESVVVGTGDYEAHTTREYVKISEMLQAAQFCESFISDTSE